jgi:hypothetical protein
MIETTSTRANALIELRKQARMAVSSQKNFPLSWSVDTSKHTIINFKGYEQGFKPSDATGLQRMFYDRSKPYTKPVTYYNVYKGDNFITTPNAYIIPQGWSAVIDLLKLNGVTFQRLNQDTVLEVEAYHIDDYKASPKPYEKHHKNSGVKISLSKQNIHFLKGDYVILMGELKFTKNQRIDMAISRNTDLQRYIIEMLEPTGDDSFFAWNFFDAILQQKEGYSDYRWEDLAAEVLKNNPDLKTKLEEKKKADPKFASNGSAQLDFIYKNSPYYEPGHNRYPVYRLVN